MDPACFGGLALATKAALGICIGVLTTGNMTPPTQEGLFYGDRRPYELQVPSEPNIINVAPAPSGGKPEAARRSKLRKGALLIGLALAGEGDSRGVGLALTATRVP